MKIYKKSIPKNICTVGIRLVSKTLYPPRVSAILFTKLWMRICFCLSNCKNPPQYRSHIALLPPTLKAGDFTVQSGKIDLQA
jgi:hypothetical protein